MRIFVLGSRPDDATDEQWSALRAYCRRLGVAVRAAGHDLNVCSVFEDSADRALLDGMAESDAAGTAGRVTAYFPDDEEIERSVRALSRALPFRLHCEPLRTPALGDAMMSHAYLLCQLVALEACDVLIAAGGRRDGTAALLLRLAEAKGTAIVPVSCFGGAAADYYQANRSQYRHQAEVLTDPDRVEDVVCIAAPGAVRPGSLGQARFFISYSRRNAEQADVVENVLRRRGVMEPFRDEDAISVGEDWLQRIRAALDAADVFVALWSVEYACSPHCFQEMHEALERLPELQVWLFALDDTRVTFPRAQVLQLGQGTTRQALSASLDLELSRYKDALLARSPASFG